MCASILRHTPSPGNPYPLTPRLDGMDGGWQQDRLAVLFPKRKAILIMFFILLRLAWHADN